MVFFRDVGYTDARLPPGFPSTPPPTLGTRGREAGGPWSPRAAQRVRLRCEHMDGARASAKPDHTRGPPGSALVQLAEPMGDITAWAAWCELWMERRRRADGWTVGGKSGGRRRGQRGGSWEQAPGAHFLGTLPLATGTWGGPCSRGAGCVARRGRTLSARGRFQSRAEACEDQGRPRAGRIWS